MFNRICVIALSTALLVTGTSFADVSAVIEYDLTKLGGGQWQYEYRVRNTSTTDTIKEFTIWFDQSLYDNLSAATQTPVSSSWSELVSQPDEWISLDGFYDALNTTGGIAPGANDGYFAVNFDWLGDGVPGVQPFEIIDSVTFETLYSNVTIPEPTTLFIIGVGVILCGSRRR